jgi:hypothetical protein
MNKGLFSQAVIFVSWRICGRTKIGSILFLLLAADATALVADENQCSIWGLQFNHYFR